MNSQLFLALLKDVAIPELTAFIHTHFAKTGSLPTEEDLKNSLDTIGARIIMKGESLIDQIKRDHPELNDGTNQ